MLKLLLLHNESTIKIVFLKVYVHYLFKMSEDIIRPFWQNGLLGTKRVSIPKFLVSVLLSTVVTL